MGRLALPLSPSLVKGKSKSEKLAEFQHFLAFYLLFALLTKGSMYYLVTIIFFLTDYFRLQQSEDTDYFSENPGLMRWWYCLIVHGKWSCLFLLVGSAWR